MRSSTGCVGERLELRVVVGVRREQRAQLLHAAVDDLVEQREEQPALALERRVDGALRVAGLVGDVVERRAVVAVAEEAPLGGAPAARGASAPRARCA